MCHSRGKLQGRGCGIEDLKYVNVVRQLWEVVERSMVNELSAPQECPAFRMPHNTVRQVDFAGNPFITSLY
jgi:hypothetical protein